MEELELELGWEEKKYVKNAKVAERESFSDQVIKFTANTDAQIVNTHINALQPHSLRVWYECVHSEITEVRQELCAL